MHMLGMCLTARPHFVQQQRAGRVSGAMQIIAKAAVFFSCRTNQRAQFASSKVSCPSRARRITMSVTASFGSFPPAAPRDFRAPRFGLSRSRSSRLTLRHNGRDCNLNRATRKPFRRRWNACHAHCCGKNVMSTGDGTSTTCPVGVRPPVARSILKTTMLFESWFSASRYLPLGRSQSAAALCRPWESANRSKRSLRRINGKNRQAFRYLCGDVEKFSVRVYGGFGHVVPAGESRWQRRHRPNFLERPFFRVVSERRRRRGQFAHTKTIFLLDGTRHAAVRSQLSTWRTLVRSG